MKLVRVGLLSAFAVAMSLGQVLFKKAAMVIAMRGSEESVISAAITNVPLAATVALYVALTALWVYILTFVELSRAYPFLALAFAVTPVRASSRSRAHA